MTMKSLKKECNVFVIMECRFAFIGVFASVLTAFVCSDRNEFVRFISSLRYGFQTVLSLLAGVHFSPGYRVSSVERN